MAKGMTNAPGGAGNAAPLDSPKFTGTPTAPTAGAGTSTDQIATTAFVQAAIKSITNGNEVNY